MNGMVERQKVADMLLDLRNTLVDRIGIEDSEGVQYGLNVAVNELDQVLKELRGL
jgi:hypothetical protein